MNPVDEAEATDTGASLSIVGIGASAGGLEAFTQLLNAVPASTGMAFVLVQHLAPTHVSALAEILSRATSMPVMEAHDGTVVEADHVYVIPPNRCMGIADGALVLEPREKIGHTRVIDHFFRALAEQSRHRAIGVVLSGTASDGTLGLEAIKAEGGITFAQDDSAQHAGMPSSAIASGCVDYVLPPAEIAREIARIGAHPYAAPQPSVGARATDADGPPDLSAILQLVHDATGVDFSQYKFNTVYRRIGRRLLLQKTENLDEYLKLLRETPGEVDALHQDLLINVTSFFRNPDAFESLRETVFPRLLKDRGRNDPVRMWTLGCSTGQEAYSLAIAWTEYAESIGAPVSLQLFATDLSAANVDKARAGLYPKDIEQDVSPARLHRFFTEDHSVYRIVKSIRDLCVFSRHNGLADPPFSRMDLISCRNLLIYLEPALQTKILHTLHYALKPEGCLWLGGSESVGTQRALFEPLHARHKVYSRKAATGAHAARTIPFRSPVGTSLQSFAGLAAPGRIVADLPREADRLLLSRYAPPAVLVSQDMEILQYRGDTGAYLAPAPGHPSTHLLKMLREGLVVGVRAAVLRAGKEQVPVREEGLRVSFDGVYREVIVEVIPVRSTGVGAHAEQGGFLILFEDADGKPARTVLPAAPAPEDTDHARLARELAATRDYLQATVEQHEAAIEELQSASEEVQSANEELQSTNEELETSKEEIQSANEELATVNDELHNRNLELGRVNNDLLNLSDSAQMAVVILGPDLRIRRLTPTAASLLKLDARDVGRPFSSLRLDIELPENLESLLLEMLDPRATHESEVRDRSGRWYSLRLRPYKTHDNRTDGVVLMLVDVDAMRHSQDAMRVSEERYRTLFNAMYEAYCVIEMIYDADGKPVDYRFVEVNQAFEKHAGLHDALGKRVRELVPGIDAHWITRYSEIASRREPQRFTDEIKALGRWVEVCAFPVGEPDSRRVAVLFTDMTQPKRMEDALRDSERRFRTLADSMPQLAWMARSDGDVFWFNKRWLDYTGTTLEQMKGHGWQRVHDPELLPEIEAKFAAAFVGGENWEDTFPLRRHDGAMRWHLSRMVPVRDEQNRIVLWFGTNTDITEQREMAEALRQNAADMAQSDHRKDEFLATLAHELRNPLAPLSNALEILRVGSADPAAVRETTDMMRRQLAQMVHLVDDLLEVSRISHGKIELRKSPVELASVLHQAVEAVRPLCEAKGHELQVTVPQQPLWLDADPTRLGQVFGNLLNNACKYSDPGGHISVAIQSEQDQAIVTVKDHGIGISAEQLPLIFEMFAQVDASVGRTLGGLGIGLSLARNMVQLHGGSLEAHSAGIGQGSEFVVRLPIDPEAAVATPADPRPAIRQRPRRILVVDDNLDSADSLSALLALSGHQTRMAHNGEQALAAAARFRPELVLLDIGLPKLNGYEVARAIRKEAWGKTMVLVALTGWGQTEDRRKSHDAGFDHHLVKPVDLAVLERLLTQES